MKSLSFASLSRVSALCAAIWASSLPGALAFDGQTVCKKPLEETASRLICTKEADELMDSRNTQVKVNALPFSSREPSEFGYPDDSVSIKSSSVKSIQNSQKQIIGYLHQFTLQNSETTSSEKLKIYYNLKGQVIAGEASPVR